MKAPDKPPTWLQAINATFFHSVIEQGKRCALSRGFLLLQAPMASRTRATDPQQLGLVRRDKSTIPAKLNTETVH